MKYLVFGGYGQLGLALQHVCPLEVELISLDSKTDITNFDTVERVIYYLRPDVVVNAAAYTNVRQAEIETFKAFSVNSLGAENVAKVCAKYDIRFIHISTDYVFDGLKEGSYTPEDIAKPLNVYGLSKLEGEQRVLSAFQKSLIIRTSWVYSEFGNNFAKTILHKASLGEELKVVNDQFGNPTDAKDLAKTIFNYGYGLYKDEKGIVHYAGLTKMSWFDFAKKLTANLSDVKITAVKSTDFVDTVKRPVNSSLKTTHKF